MFQWFQSTRSESKWVHERPKQRNLKDPKTGKLTGLLQLVHVVMESLVRCQADPIHPDLQLLRNRLLTAHKHTCIYTLTYRGNTHTHTYRSSTKHKLKSLKPSALLVATARKLKAYSKCLIFLKDNTAFILKSFMADLLQLQHNEQEQSNIFLYPLW